MKGIVDDLIDRAVSVGDLVGNVSDSDSDQATNTKVCLNISFEFFSMARTKNTARKSQSGTQGSAALFQPSSDSDKDLPTSPLGRRSSPRAPQNPKGKTPPRQPPQKTPPDSQRRRKHLQGKNQRRLVRKALPGQVRERGQRQVQEAARRVRRGLNLHRRDHLFYPETQIGEHLCQLREKLRGSRYLPNHLGKPTCQEEAQPQRQRLTVVTSNKWLEIT